MALTMSPMTSAALSAVSVDKAGVASGVLNTFRQVGGSLGIAVLGAILASYVSVAPRSPQFADQFVTGLQHALYTSAGIAFAAALVAAVDDPQAQLGTGFRGRGGGGGMTSPRLSAPERRQAVLDAACRIFSDGSYRGTTTAEIARESGVSEPILYRHFASKRELYLACLEAAWADTRGRWEERVAAEPDPARWIPAIAVEAFEVRECPAVLADLWVQALSVSNDDPVIAAALSAQMREVHDYVAGLIRRSQAAGGVVGARDPEAEAWIFVSVGLLRTVAGRLGGLLGPDDLDRIRAARAEWMLGLTA